MSARKKRPPLAHLDRSFSRPALVEAMAASIAGLEVRLRGGHLILGLGSALQREGTTTVAIYLARQIASTFEIPTLVVEANMRRPSMARYCRVEATPGLRGFLGRENGGASLADVVRSTSQPTLDVLPAGGREENPLSLIGSDRFAAFLDETRQRYAVTVIDAPPVLAHSESTVILEATDRRALIVEADRTPRREVHRALSRLEESDVKMHGTILNRRRFLFG